MPGGQFLEKEIGTNRREARGGEEAGGAASGRAESCRPLQPQENLGGSPLREVPEPTLLKGLSEMKTISQDTELLGPARPGQSQAPYPRGGHGHAPAG